MQIDPSRLARAVTGLGLHGFQRGDRMVVRLADGESGLSARTIARRLSSVSGFYAYVVARGDTALVSNPVPRGLATRRERGSKRSRTVPLVRVPRTLPKILAPGEVGALVGALRTQRDRAMVLAMVLGGLRRCEVLGLRLADLWVGERRLFIAEGKGGHQRVVPIADRFFAAVGDYIHDERPRPSATDRVFVVLKEPRRGQPLSADGVDEILTGARRRHPRFPQPGQTGVAQLMTRRLEARGSDEVEHVHRTHLEWVLRHHAEERLQIERRRPHRVRSGPSGHERQIAIHQRVAQLIADLAGRIGDTNQARRPRHPRTLAAPGEMHADTRWITRVLGDLR
jgi:integrase